MIDSTRKRREQAQKDRVRRRINTKIDPENYEFRPAKKQVDYYDNEVEQRVAVYARVSTGNVQQTTSYELQKKYYEDFVIHHPNWTLVKIYADVDAPYGQNTKRREQPIYGCPRAFFVLSNRAGVYFVYSSAPNTSPTISAISSIGIFVPSCKRTIFSYSSIFFTRSVAVT